MNQLCLWILLFYKLDNFLKWIKDMELMVNIVLDDLEIILKCEKIWIRFIKLLNEVGF